VSALISLIDRLPPDLVTLPPDAFADFITQLEILRVKHETATARGGDYRYSAEPVWHLRRYLEMCVDESPAGAGHDLLFVDEPRLREDLGIDLAEAYSSLHAGRWKAATVLGGSIIEALLVWRLSKLSSEERAAAIAKVAAVSDTKPKGGPPEDWWLWQLIEVAAVAPVIDKTTAAQIRLAKEFRNLIHPGRSLRTGERAGKDTALGALAGVERVIRDVSRVGV
jgi:hypothetical protein